MYRLGSRAATRRACDRLGFLISACAVWLALAGCVSTVPGTGVVVGSGGGRTATTVRGGLPGMLLSLDDMARILRFSGMTTEQIWHRPDERGVFQPARCVGAVFSGMAASFQGSRYRDFYEVRMETVSPDSRHHWVDEGVASFQNPDAARSFVADQVAHWRQCAGGQFMYAFPGPGDWNEPYTIGHPVDAGCVTVINNVVDGDTQYDDIRVLAAKADIVVDLQFTGFELTDEPLTAVNSILERIPSRGRGCAFWG
jgi:hypothetical protein